jgi:hypothetical protein
MTERTERIEPNARQDVRHQTGEPGWCSVDPGDTHDKGEQSLCVGEAA